MRLAITKEDVKVLIMLLHKEADEVAKDITHPSVDKVECLNYVAYLKSLAKHLSKQLEKLNKKGGK